MLSKTALQHPTLDSVQHSTETMHEGSQPFDFVPLHLENRTHVSTAVLCRHLNRQAQTARIWAMRESGPIRPVRINGRLAWPVARIRELLGVA